MRVIAGTARGRRLTAPAGQHTRPTPERVREALFSILGVRVDAARALDLFAGTGALGIEALSRGATHATFVDNDRRAQSVLRRNLALLDGHAQSTRLLPLEVSRALVLLAGERFDLVFLDPPYDAGLCEPTLAALAAAHLVSATGIVVCEHRGKSAPPTAPNGLVLHDARRWGDTAMSFFVADPGESP